MSLAWQMVRHRFAGFAGTFAAIAAGVALVAGAFTLYLSAQPQIPDRYASAPALVRSPQVGTDQFGRDEYRPWSAAEAITLAGQLAAAPGATAAVPDPAFYAQRVVDGKATGDPEESLHAGHSWGSAALGGYRLTAGRAPTAANEVALGGAEPGATVDVLTAAGPVRWTVTGTTDGPGFYVADDVAMRMSAGVRVIGVLTSDPAAVPGALTGADRAQLEPESDSRTRWIGTQLLIAMVGLGGFVAVFVVSSTAALAAAARRREIGLLRAIGATPGQVRRLMYAETTVVAVLAGLVGVPLGALTAPLLTGPLIGAGLEPASFTVTAQPLAWAIAFLLGLLVALAGVTVAARRTSRTPPLEALREAAVEKRAMTPARWVLGLLGAATGITLLATLSSMPIMTQTSVGLLAAMALLTAAGLLAPVVLVPLVRAVTWPWRRAATGMLVREGTLTGVRRVASTAAPVLLAVGFTVLLSGTVATIEEATGIDEAAKIPAGTILAPAGTPGLSDAAVAAQPGESRLTTRVQLSHNGNVTSYDATGIDFPATSAGAGSPDGGSVDGGLADGGLADGGSVDGGSPGAGSPDGGPPGAGSPDAGAADPGSTGDAPAGAAVPMILGVEDADELGVRAGDSLPLRWADGTTATATVAEVSADAPAAIAVPRGLIRAHDPGALTAAVWLEGPAASAPGAEVLTARDYVQRSIDEEGNLIDVFLWVLIGLSVGYTGLAVANTLLMATASRRPEFRALRMAGAGTGQVLRVTTAEALLAVVTGTALGAAVAGISLAGVSAAVEAELSIPVPVVVPWGAAAIVTAACALVAVAATAMPVARASARTA